MTTRRGEPIEAEPQSVEDVLRPLAERVAPCPLCQGDGRRVDYGWSARAGVVITIDCPKTAPDPRFEALRRRRGYVDDGAPWPLGLDASLGAIVRASAACGYNLIEIAEYQGVWVVSMAPSASSILKYGSRGSTPEQAAANALAKAEGDDGAA